MAVQTVKLDDIIMALPKSKIKAGDGINTGKYKFFTCSPIQSKYYDSFTYEGESLIMGTGGNANIHYCNEKFATSTDCLVFQKKGNLDINLKCVYYLLYGNIDLLQRGFKGCGLQHISKDYILNIEINLPERNVQDKIVDIFDHYNKVKQLKLDELTAYDNLVKSQFIEMFGDIILNNKCWNEYTWNKVLTIKNGRNQSQVENPNGQYAICGSGGIMGYADEYLTESNSVIIGRKGNINKPILMREKFWNVDTAFGIEPNTTMLNVEYLYLYCLFFDFEKLNKAVTIPSLTKSDLLNINMPLPPLALQNEFAHFVEQTDKSKILCELEVAA